jgi:hypothetical protein
MLRTAIVRGLLSGGITASAGIGALSHHVPTTGGNGVVVQTSDYPSGALLVAAIAGLASIIVALITVLGPLWLKRVADRDPKVRETKDEALESLADALKDSAAENARKERTIQRLIAERERGEVEHAPEPD